MIAAGTTGSSSVADGILSIAKEALSKFGLDKTDLGQKVISSISKLVDIANKAQSDIDANKEEAKEDTSKKAVAALKKMASEKIVYDNDSTFNLNGFTLNYGEPMDSSTLNTFLNAANIGTHDLRADLIGDKKVLRYQVVTGDNLSSQDFSTLVNKFSTLGNGITLPITLKITDPSNDNANLGSVTFNFVNNKEVAVPSTSLTIDFDSPIHVNSGDSAIDPTLVKNVDFTVTNEKGETVKPTHVTPGEYYTSKDAALKNGQKANVGQYFAGDGLTYYQPITLEFDKDAVNVASIFSNMIKDGSQVIKFSNGDEARSQNINRDANTITYVREFQVGSGFDNNTDKPDTDNNNNEDNNNDANLENGVWVEDNATGKVTVGNSVASLYDDNNNLTNRAVAANSAWATDKSRVNSKTGLKQYHVSTHEWVNADDVTFSGDENNGSNALGTIANLSGHHTVDLDGPSGFVYALFSSDGKRSNRGLAGNTSWYTDKSATDGEGNTYYRVSTDEWIRVSSGVTFK
ncbi:hypothetical protein [Companilactobacillus zhongbaensis]|uniref:hypothetical protein n=1 Tax=Companilactobacillus zhongbaensis TaxID=2486009 RepID=UPI000F76863E|nr:hypothetical protein [Companilactobacillus zhongbaensis]